MKKWSEFLEGRCWPGYKPKPGKKAYSPGSCVKEDLRQWFDPDHPKGGWKRINSKGEAIGPCAREPGEAKPRCMSNEKRASLSKKERASAVASKRKHDPNPERKGQPINVSNFGKGKISENMENLDEKNVPTSPEKWAQAKSQAKAKFDVYPSAYANGWAAKKYKEMGGGWKSVSEESEVVQEGRPSQRHPLEGHEYHKKSNEALIHIAKDAHKAAEAMKSHNTTAENKYRDQANDSATVRYFRQKNGMPEWYKKKYGHIKEAKEKTEYDYEGDMARGQLQSIINNSQRVHDMLEDNDNLPEWVQSKITLAEDYISTVANYMMSEVDEEVVVEASYKDTRGTLKDRLAGEVLNFHSMHDRIPSTSEFGRSVKSKPKQQAISHAKKLLGVQVKKEEVESIEEADALLARTGMNSAHKFPRAGQTNLKNIPAMNTPGNSKETDDYAEKRRGDRAKQLKPAIKAALGTHGPKGKLPEEVEPIEELSKNTLKSYIPAAARDLSKKGINAGIDAKSGKPGVTKEYGDHFEKRYKGIIKATRKLAKEGVVNEVMDEPNYSLSIQARQKKADVSKKNDATTSAEIGTPAQLSLKVAPKKLETPVYESRQMQIVREALADAKKKDAAKKKEKKVNPGGDDKFQAEPELTSSITKNT